MSKLSLSPSFLMEASPILDDASADSSDAYLRAFATIAAKIEAAKSDRYGYVTIEVDAVEAQVLILEGTYRAQSCRERAQDAYDNVERMQMLGSARGCAGVAKRAQAIVAAG